MQAQLSSRLPLKRCSPVPAPAYHCLQLPAQLPFASKERVCDGRRRLIKHFNQENCRGRKVNGTVMMWLSYLHPNPTTQQPGCSLASGCRVDQIYDHMWLFQSSVTIRGRRRVQGLEREEEEEKGEERACHSSAPRAQPPQCALDPTPASNVCQHGWELGSCCSVRAQRG